MKLLRLSAAAAALSFIATTAAAQRTDCDFTYVIQDGDTLPDIAETAFGRRTYTLIYARNFGKIVNPGNLPAGEEITIPCLPGDASQTPDAAALTARMEGAPAPAPSARSEPEEEVLVSTAAPAFDEPAGEDAAPRHRFLTASGLPPFADEGLRNGGMASELTSRAMRKLVGAEDFEIVFINDRDKHLRELLLKGSFDAAFPWVRPHCEQVEQLRDLAPADAWMCDRMLFSEPYYELVAGFFIKRGAASNRSAFEDFAAASICRPSGPPTIDLAVNGITEEFADIYRPKRAEDCLQLLMTGVVDAVSADVFEVEAAMADLGVADEVEELPELSLLTAYVAVTPRGRPDSVAALDALNQGMLELKLSGEWYRVVARHLAQN